MKDKLNELSKSIVVYSFIGKTEQTLFERTKEYVTRVDSAIKGHLDNCLNVEHLFSINNLILNDVNMHKSRLNLVHQNTRIIDESNNWNIYCLKKHVILKKNVQF